MSRVDTEKSRVPVTGGELAYVDAGDPDEPAVLLLSGGFTSSHLWRSLVPMLSPFMRVLAPDLLGSGDSTAAAGADLSLRGHALTIRELLDRLGVERVAVAGHGHGGGVAQLVALERRAEALVLIDSIAFDAWPPRRMRELRERPGDVDEAFVREWMVGTLSRGTSKASLSETDLGEYLRPFAGPGGVDRFRRVLDSFDGEGLVEIEPRLNALEIPALVLWGEDDAILDSALAERIGDALPMASVGLLPGCGHFLLEDALETVAPLIFQWLRSRYLKIEHRHEHEEGPVKVYLGRRPPGEGG